MNDQTIHVANTDTASVLRISVALLHSYREWRKRRRDLAELKSLSSAMLRDLAIDRSEIQSVVYSQSKGRRRDYV